MRLIALALIGTLGVGVHATQSHTEASPAIVEAPALPFAEIPHYRSSPIVATTTTTTTVPVFQPAPDAKCPEWHTVALDAGWPIHALDRLDLILWRESRCLPDAFNPDDPNGGSIGILQINKFWCKPSRYNPEGWLQAQGLLTTCADLYDPLTNLTAARAIFEYAEARGCGWGPWATRNTRWC
jgi:hypothetical protein